MDEPKGERMTMPMPFSQTETEYKKGEQRIDVEDHRHRLSRRC